MQDTHTAQRERNGQTERSTNGAAAPGGAASKERAFLETLVHELFQTEQSAVTHSNVEADRLGDVRPAHVLRAVAAQAATVLAELPSLMKVRGLPVSQGGRTVGKLFSVIRNALADRLLSSEKSYRGTILGMRHGIDLVTLIQHVATANGDPLLAAWCARWLEARRPLVEAVANELSWFAAHPKEATEGAKKDHRSQGGFFSGIVAAFRRLIERIRLLVPARARG